MSKISIENTFDLQRWREMDDFLVENYSSNYILRNKQLFEWQFRNPANPNHATLVCAYADRRLIGILGYMPLSLFWGNWNQTILAAWMANWMVTSAKRQGTGILLMRRLQECFPVLLGQGANALNRAIVGPLGFQFHPAIPRFVRVFKLKETLDLLPEAARDAAASALKAIEGVIIPALSAEVRQVLTDQDLDRYAPEWSAYPCLIFGTIRNAAYLRWRYRHHPLFKYRILMSGSPDLPAVCVYRIEKTRGSAEVLVGRIVEFFAPATPQGESSARDVLGTALQEMEEAGCLFSDFICSSTAWISKIGPNFGMMALPHGTLPSRLSPVELTSRPQNLEIWTAQNQVRLQDLSLLYVTKSDGDQDRPN